MKYAYILALCLLASCRESQEQKERNVFRRANALALRGKYSEALKSIDSIHLLYPHYKPEDSLTKLRIDIDGVATQDFAENTVLLLTASQRAALQNNRWEGAAQLESSRTWIATALKPLALRAPEIEEKQKKKARIAREDAAMLAQYERDSYATELRNKFLDEGMDIKVKVTGKQSQVLTLEYPLMNAVWSRKFHTSGSIDRWFEMGYQEVILKDGYQYQTKWSR